MYNPIFMNHWWSFLRASTVIPFYQGSATLPSYLVQIEVKGIVGLINNWKVKK